MCVARCNELTALAEEAEEDAAGARAELDQLQERSGARVQMLEKKLAQLTEKDTRSAAHHRSELETALIRIQSESQSMHEAAVVSMREQHRRELSCLQEEMASEKKR
jgi:hypothetical protein